MLEDHRSEIKTVDMGGMLSYIMDGDGIKIIIGGTPVLELELFGVSFYAKAEWFNHFTIKNTNFKHGSVKMRSAFFMVNYAIENENLKAKTII
ncbi:MAG: hypothetical protein ACP5NC_08140, partial [Nitrososphaeria archaeon]